MIGVPLDLGAGRRGVDMGPSALRIAGIQEQIAELGYTVEDLGDLGVSSPEICRVQDSHARYVQEIAEICQRLHDRARERLTRGDIVLALGGDHSLAVGSIAASASVTREQGRPLAVIWVDAHADMNTPESSPSGNVHGMPLAACLGRGHPLLVELGGFSPKLDPLRCAAIGLRNLDERERELVRKSGIRAYTMKDIDRRGVSAVMEEALAAVTAGGSAIHVSFDVDGVDPEVTPGVGTPVQGGLSYREAHLIMELVAETGRLIAMDITEVNPILDYRNSTACRGVEFVTSALGKDIL